MEARVTCPACARTFQANPDIPLSQQDCPHCSDSPTLGQDTLVPTPPESKPLNPLKALEGTLRSGISQAPPGPRTQSDLRPGDVLGSCVIQAPVGRGGMGIVYLARHQTLDMAVAVKVLPPSTAHQRSNAASRFLREARLAARLRHPNVVAVMDAGHDAVHDVSYIVMEYVDGGSVHQQLACGPLSEDQAVGIALSVARALVEASAHSIVHRDIKPGNILIDSHGTAKLSDLGLARDPNADGELLTHSSATLGTPLYMSPEQVQDARVADTRSDIYSLGATLFHMVTGQPPFAGTSAFDIGSQVLAGKIPDPLDLIPDLTPDLGELIQRMLARDPASRPATAAELVEELEDLAPRVRRTTPLRVEPTGVLHGPGAHNASGVRRRHRRVRKVAGIAAVAAAAFALGAGVFFLAPHPGQGRRLDLDHGREGPDRRWGPGAPGRPHERPPRRGPAPPGLPVDAVFAVGFDDPPRVPGPPRNPPLDVRFGRMVSGGIGRCIALDGPDAGIVLPGMKVRAVALSFRASVAAAARLLEVVDDGEGPGPLRLSLVTADRSPAPLGGLIGLCVELPATAIYIPVSDPLQWNHVALSWDGDKTLTVLVGGAPAQGFLVPQDQPAAAATSPFVLPSRLALSDTPKEVLLGMARSGSAQTSPEAFQGQLDDLAIWSRPLSIPELEKLHGSLAAGEGITGYMRGPERPDRGGPEPEGPRGPPGEDRWGGPPPPRPGF